MEIRSGVLIVVLAGCFSFCQTAAAGIVVEDHPPEPVMQQLRAALGQYSKEVSSSARSQIGPGSLGTKAIIVVDTKPGKVSGGTFPVSPSIKPGSAPGGSSRGAKGIVVVDTKPGLGSSLAAKGIVIINNRPGVLAAQRRLMQAVRMFERSAGPNSPSIRACRTQEGQCLQKCRSALMQSGLTGQCSCIGVRAQCLNGIQFNGVVPGGMRRLPGRR